MRVIYCYGDSNTWGYDPRSFYGSRYPEPVLWTSILERRTGCRVVNDGANGRMIPEGGKQIAALLRNVERYISPGEEFHFWIMLGSNDLINHPDNGARQTADRMERFLKDFLFQPVMQRPQCRMRLIAPPLMKRGEWVETDTLVMESAGLAARYRELADTFGIAFSDAGDLPVLYDGVHLSEQGHREIAERLLRAGREDGFIDDYELGKSG